MPSKNWYRSNEINRQLGDRTFKDPPTPKHADILLRQRMENRRREKNRKRTKKGRR